MNIIIKKLNNIYYNKKNLRLDKLLVFIFNKYSRSLLKKCIINNNLIINNKIYNNPKKKIKYLSNNTIIKLNINNYNKQLEIIKQNIKLNFIYINDNFLILNKDKNLVIETNFYGKNTKGTLMNALAYYYPDNKNLPRYGIVHRLDKNTTGLMVIARNMEYYLYLKNLFKIHKVNRLYDSIVYGNLNKKTGIINLPILRHPKKRICMSVSLLGKKAITYYRIKNKFINFTRLNLKLKTGRTHQIRVHLSYINHPLVGDDLYYLKKYDSLKKKINFLRPALHSYKLGFKDLKTNKYNEWICPFPFDYKNLLNIIINK